MAKIEAFEKYFNEYETWFVKNKFVYQSEINAIKLHLPKYGTGLEIGTGTGRFSVPFNIKYGIEPSLKMRKIAQKKGLNVLNGIAEKLPFENSKFDYVLIVTTICFIDNINIAFQEAYRVLKKRGQFIIGFVDKDSPVGKFYLKNRNKSKFYTDAHFFSVKEVIIYLKKTGFKKFKFCQTVFNDLKKIKSVEPVKEGYGSGSFIVINAYK